MTALCAHTKLSIVQAGGASCSVGTLASPEEGGEEAQREPGVGGIGSSHPRREFHPPLPHPSDCLGWMKAENSLEI